MCPQGRTKNSPEGQKAANIFNKKPRTAGELGFALKNRTIFGIKRSGHEFDGTQTGLCGQWSLAGNIKE